MFDKQTIRDVNIKDEIVLVRVDYNVPLEQTEDGAWQVKSDLRIRASLPTIEYLRERGAKKIILMSHLGRPEGRDESLSLKPMAEALAELMQGVSVDFVDEISGPEVVAAVEELPDGGILLLENLRFEPGEKQNSEDFAREIVESIGATLFVQDGFAATHRAHASTEAVTRLLPAVAGFLVEKEVKLLTQALKAPEKPLVVIIGGAKVEDKEPLIEKFLPIADKILVGGKIAADGYVPKDSKVYVAEDFDEDGEGNKLDIGPIATGKFVEAINDAKTVLWNGVLGKVEDAAFATGSEIVAKTLGEKHDVVAIICGGDTTGFVQELMEDDPDLEFALVSTGGGAALESLTGGAMPGIEKLWKSE